jgi:hypothetical protein
MILTSPPAVRFETGCWEVRKAKSTGDKPIDPPLDFKSAANGPGTAA